MEAVIDHTNMSGIISGLHELQQASCTHRVTDERKGQP